MLQLRRTHEFSLRLSASAALPQSAGSPRAAVNTARPSSTRTYRPPRQTSGPPSKPPRPETANRKRQTDPSPRSRRTGAPQAPAHRRGTGASRDRGRPGPRRVRTPSKTPGPRRAPAVTTSAQQPQVTRPSPLRPPTAKQHRAGFEPLTPTAAAGQRPLPTRQASPRTGQTLPPRWCHRRQARAMFSLTGRAPDVP
jgi:hypothetical protein